MNALVRWCCECVGVLHAAQSAHGMIWMTLSIVS